MKRTLATTCCLALLAAACVGDDDAAAPEVVETGTVGLGVVPGPPSDPGLVATPATVPVPETTAAPQLMSVTAPVGDVADGARLLLIGDSALLSTTPRRDGVGCDVLSGMGWQVDIEAELGRYVGFAEEVVDELVVDSGTGWDVIGFMFGQHLDRTDDEFVAQLAATIDEVGDLPILLYTRSEVDDASADLNDAIRDLADDRPNVLVVDWGDAVATEQELDLVDDDGLPTADGMERIVLLTAGALGTSPGGADDGECLEPVFTDDSAIVI